ncbi:glycosyltransferase [Citreimonas sp.]|uniref:glycosyltransferase n=1 Tax=Citreimonas sp. TaxID=3036715 RepID=UPI004057DCCF
MSPPRVLHVFETWPPIATGYASRSALIVRHQAEQGIAEPRVLVSSRQHDFAGQADAPARMLAPSPRERLTRRLRPYDLDVAHLARAVAREARDVDIVHGHFSSGIGRAVARGAREAGRPFVAEVRFDLAGAAGAQSGRLMTMLEPVLRRRFEGHLRHADAVVAASHALGRFLVARGLAPADRLHVIANGAEPVRADPAETAALRTRLGLDADAAQAGPVIGTTSAMLAYEGLERLVEAAARVPGATLLMVGDGPERSRLEAHAKAAGVRAIFTGAVPRAAVPAHLALIDVFGVPRRSLSVTRYASPLKVAEAMAAGRAIVAADVGDIAEMLADGRGVVVPPDAPDAFAAAVAELAADTGARERLGRAARAHAESDMTWAARIAGYRAVYAGLA